MVLRRYQNTTDLIHWLRALLKGRVLKSRFKDMFAAVPVDPKASFRQDQDFYGLGIYKTFSKEYGEIVWNSGNNYGYGVLIAHSVDRNITFALAINVSRKLINLHNDELVAEVLKEILLR